MTPSDLTRRLTLEAAVHSPDGFGGFAESWTALGEHWAKVDPSRGRLRGRGDLTLSEVPTEIIVRGSPVGSMARPVPDQRFREGVRVWRVLAVTELDTAGRYLRCDTIEESTA